MSGFAEVTGFPDKPPTLPSLGLADGIAACFSTFAAMFAVYWRDVAGGTGQYIDTSLVEPLFGMMGRITVDHAVNGNVPTRTGNRSDFTAPRNTYRTEDDKWVAMSASAETIAKRILRTVGGEELATDPRFQSNEARVDRVDELDEIIQDWIGERTRDEVVRLFNENEAAVAPVYNIEDIFNDSFFRERDALVDVDDPEYDDLVLPGVFPHMSETPGDIEHAGPPLGEHTIDVLAAYTDADTETLRELDRESVVHIHD
jgi:formyl-CoA transferase